VFLKIIKQKMVGLGLLGLWQIALGELNEGTNQEI
jgi:hypothetical protein